MSQYIINHRISVSLQWRSRNSFLGRFGGGWNWKLGIQIGGATMIISLLILEIIICLNDKK